MNLARFISFNTQRAIFALIFSLLPTALSIGVLWNHLNSLLIFTGIYLILTRIGLLMVETTAVMLTVWELSVKDKVLSTYCFFANLIIVLIMLGHVGAIIQYNSSKMSIKAKQEARLDTSRKLIDLASQSTINQSRELLDTIASNSKLRSKSTITDVAKSALEVNSKNTSSLLNVATQQDYDNEITTYLPISYIESGTIIVIPILTAFLLAAIAQFISKTSIDTNLVSETSPQSKFTIPTVTLSESDDTEPNMLNETGQLAPITVAYDRDSILNQLRKSE